MRYLLTIILTSYFTLANCQELTLYYNDAGELTISDLASHYRIAKFDSLYNEFNGKSFEYDFDSLITGIYSYENGSLLNLALVKDADTTKYLSSQIPDSLATIVGNKNSYVQANYIRKMDYQPIFRKLSAIPMDEGDSIMWEGEKVRASEIFTIVEDPASFPGGMNTMVKFLSFYLEYPEAAQKEGITGKVFTEFIINKDGTISDIRVNKGIGYGCDEAAIRAISQLPDWKPGYQRGKPVNVKMTLPITFQ